MSDSGYPSSSQGSCRSQRQIPRPRTTAPSTIYPGKLKKVLLKNFMCHEHFEIEFNPCVNFIHGRNGSGKSAIATALVLGFGQRATTTNRGVAVKGFIKRGRRQATIEITMHNVGVGNKFREDKYGNEITVIRKILESGGSQYKIRGETGQEENLSRQVLDSLLLHFNIQPNNPLCILSQDTARSFFKSRDPKEMYKLFMQGTQMESVCSTYQTNQQKISKLLKDCKRNKTELDKINEDVREADRKQEIANKLQEIQEKKVGLEYEFAWTKFRELEKEVADAEEELNKAVYDKELFEKNDGNSSNGQQSLIDKKAKLENDVQAEQVNLDNVEMGLKTNLENGRRIRNQLEDIGRMVEKEQQKKQICSANIKKLQTGIDNIQSQHSQSQEYRHKLDEVLCKLRETDAARKTTDASLNLFNDTLEGHKMHLLEIDKEIRHKERMIYDIELKKKQLTQGNKQGVYGHWMPAFLQKIEEASDRGMFSQKPRGPLGEYIKVNDEAWAIAIESQLKSTLSAFCVSCVQDNRVLTQLFNEVIRKSQDSQATMPTVFISKFFFNVHNYRENEVRSSKYKSLISSVRIDDPIVTNCLIDQHNAERLLLVPNLNEALHLMENPRNVPPNCKLVLTQQADQVYPAPNYRFYNGKPNQKVRFLQADITQQIRECDRRINDLKNDKFQLTERRKEIVKEKNEAEKAISDHLKEIDILKNKKSHFENERARLEKNSNYEPQSIEMYQAEIGENMAKSEDATKMIENLLRDKDVQKNKLQDYETEHTELIRQQSELNRRIHSIKDEIDDIEKKLREWHRLKDNYERKLAEKNDRIDKSNYKFKEKKEKMKTAKSAIDKDNIPMVEVSRNKDDIKKAISDADAAIKVYVQELGGSQQLLTENQQRNKRLFEEKTKSIKQLEECIKKTQSAVETDIERYQRVKSAQTRMAQMTFSNILRLKKLEGKLKFDFEERKLHIHVIPIGKGDSSEQPALLSALSGGERSYATTAFIRSIWCSMTPPFYVLDEFDVFTDLSNRTLIMRLLIEHAKDNIHCQYLFITPLDLSSIETNANITVHVIHNPRDEDR